MRSRLSLPQGPRFRHGAHRPIKEETETYVERQAISKEEKTSMNKKRQIGGNVVIPLGGLMLLGSAGAKLAHVPKVVSQLGSMGFDGNKLTIIALLEVVSAFLFLIPLTRSVGLLLVSSYLGGAIATHLQHDQPMIQPAFVLSLIWFGTWLRHQGVLWSFRSSQKEIGQTANAPIRA